MPSANGVYSLPPGYLAVTGATILASQHNPPLEDIAAALTLRLSRDGSAPMTGPIQFASGTVTVPGAVFAADASSGFYKTTAGIGVSILGVKVAEFLAGGVVGARVLGELVAFAGSTCPALFVFPAGQTLSRTTYAALWAFAQLEITAGNTLWNNGDGSTTFGIPDLRGRVPVAGDAMGGTAASRVTTAGSGVNGAVLGSSGGEQTHLLLTAEMPAHGHAITDLGHFHTIAMNANVGNGSTPSSSTGAGSEPNANTSTNTTGITIQNTGGGGVHNNMQPSIITNYILFAGA
jgi:microcystin-dependent protein